MKEITLLSFPNTSGTSSSNIKVPAIKALRCFANIGLREAKEVIEGLQEKRSTKVAIYSGAAEVEALKEFHRLGGVYTTEDGLTDALEAAVTMALVQKKFGVASHIASALNILMP